MRQSEALAHVRAIRTAIQKCRSNTMEAFGVQRREEIPAGVLKDLDPHLWDDDLFLLVDRLADKNVIEPSGYWNVVFIAKRSLSLEMQLLFMDVTLPEWTPMGMTRPWDPE